MGRILDGKVIKVIDNYKIVINKGSLDGVEPNNMFLIYRLGEELFDPDTNESLGHLEFVCGEGKPEHIQDRISTIVTAKHETRTAKKVIKHGGTSPLVSLFNNNYTEETYDPETIAIPFENVDKDCLFKQIK